MQPGCRCVPGAGAGKVFVVQERCTTLRWVGVVVAPQCNGKQKGKAEAPRAVATAPLEVAQSPAPLEVAQVSVVEGWGVPPGVCAPHRGGGRRGRWYVKWQ